MSPSKSQYVYNHHCGVLYILSPLLPPFLPLSLPLSPLSLSPSLPLSLSPSFPLSLFQSFFPSLSPSPFLPPFLSLPLSRRESLESELDGQRQEAGRRERQWGEEREQMEAEAQGLNQHVKQLQSNLTTVQQEKDEVCSN